MDADSDASSRKSPTSPTASTSSWSDRPVSMPDSGSEQVAMPALVSPTTISLLATLVLTAWKLWKILQEEVHH